MTSQGLLRSSMNNAVNQPVDFARFVLVRKENFLHVSIFIRKAEGNMTGSPTPTADFADLHLCIVTN